MDNKIIRVLVVDDSAYVRKVVSQMLARSPFIEVVGTARDGQHALELAEELQPDVITLDLMMPVPDGTVLTHLDARPFDMPHRPAVDVLFASAAEVYGARVLGVVMTGMGSDGCAGAGAIKKSGGQVFTESEESCVVFGMPRSVLESGHSDRCVHLDRMAQAILGAGRTVLGEPSNK